MWRQDLWKQLIWWNVEYRSLQDRAVAREDFSAPTWSWLSVGGPVSYQKAKAYREYATRPNERKFLDLESCVTVVSVMDHPQTNATGVSGVLTICGSTFSYRIFESDIKNSEWKNIEGSQMKLGHARWMLDRYVGASIDVECLVVAQDEMAKYFVCLCLVPSQDSPGHYKRIGLCQWDGFAWQVTKFVGERLTERTFTIV
jgi:hypothetical protein